MLQPKPTPPDERQLARIYRGLDVGDRRTLLAFAEFLAQKGDERDQEAQAPAIPAEPELAPRPKRETVIAAIRRLSSSYTMIDRGAMLHETSALMSAHVLHGRDAVQVIDDLEALFARHYALYRKQFDGGAGEPSQHAEKLS